MLLRCGATTVLTDPSFSDRMNGLPVLRRPAMDVGAIGRVDVLLASHLHGDHFDFDAARRLSDEQTVVVGPPGTREVCARHGLDRVVELGPWQEATVRGVALLGCPAEHTGPPPQEVNFAFTLGGWRVFFGGDAMISAHHDAIATRVRDLDLAMLPVGGSLIWLKRTTMNPQDAVSACRILRPRWALGLHEGGEWLPLPPLSLHPGRRVRFDALLHATQDVPTTPIPAGPGQTATLEDAASGPIFRVERSVG